MISPKSALLFVSGCIAGTMLTAALLTPSFRVQAATSLTGPFVDVPAHHVAAPAVAEMKSEGIITGYPNDTYRGSSPVTRYELAVILSRFAHYYDSSKQPLSKRTIQLPAAPSWASKPREYLASNLYVPTSSRIFENPGTALVTCDDVADSLSSILDRIIDRNTPPGD
jgi:hypothetical protein